MAYSDPEFDHAVEISEPVGLEYKSQPQEGLGFKTRADIPL